MKWRDVRRYVEVLRALLAGEVTEWEGAPIKMLHGPGFGGARPIDVPILIGANGPLGTEVARAVGDGIFAAAVPNERAEGWQALLMYGTVLEDGEDGSSPRVIDAAGHALAVRFHAMYERQGADGVRRYPGGEAWLRSIEAAPPERRHLAVHEGHMVTLNEHDRQAVADAATIIRKLTLTGSRSEIRDRVAAYAEPARTSPASSRRSCRPSRPSRRHLPLCCCDFGRRRPKSQQHNGRGTCVLQRRPRARTGVLQRSRRMRRIFASRSPMAFSTPRPVGT
jgi:alkanesulfonate monooxygenase SsuD/methylene tetrahydromethanopterin reductase-like flavin-dependent oxidoreductase (luciferase family)